MATNPSSLQRGAVVLPIKGFSDAKGRLEPVLSAENRASLAAFTAGGVLEAAEGVDTFVVCDNDEVAQWARERGAMVVRQHKAGLNGAVANGVDTAQYKRDWVLVAHSDLPFPEALLSVIDFTIVTVDVTSVKSMTESNASGNGKSLCATSTQSRLYWAVSTPLATAPFRPALC